jgi:hypothetical protein
MNNIIEEYYNNFNYPSIDKLYKLLKEDGHDIKKKILNHTLINNKKHKYLKKLRKVSNN